MKLTYRPCPACGTTYALPDSARRCAWCQNGYAAALRDAVEAVKAYADDTHQHKGDLFGHCRQEFGDRCDITAALRVAAQKIEAFHVYEEGSNLTAGSTVGSFLNKGDEIPDTEELSLKHELGQNQPKNGDE